MSAPASFAARRPNASTLPSFELPPPPLTGLHHKFQNYPTLNSGISSSTAAVQSVGNLLTPPSNGSADGLSPSGQLNHSGLVQPYTPNSTTSMSYPGTAPYGFQSNGQQYNQGRGLFSPSLNSIVRGNGSPSASDIPPPPSYESYQYPTSSMSMSAPALPTAHTQMLGNSMITPVSGSLSHPSPVSAHDAYARPPPTPGYHSGSQASSTPQQGTFTYSTGPSPVQQSPVSAGPLSRPSPVHAHGPIPPLHHPQTPGYPQRPYTYPLPGPILSNVSNPSAGLTLVGGVVPNGMPMTYNSGHAAMQQMYHQHPQQPNPQNDRPFRCDQCPQSFNRNHDLKRHKRIHLAVKPFPCGHCDKSFSRKDALKRHVLVKGCGKAQATADVKSLDGSTSPDTKSEETSPIISGAAP
ncbi:hypothetical protein AMS68_006706 [Peltaster fructicola]|uniref:C2H2-type domain-containing protein n=1 Tax=Peltaster fructicola TaxID=286661 RepID=A0A6H0Y2V7_9PEZI|nr:hypothetical protein AMS68_006706 [Peltaster fructicola]